MTDPDRTLGLTIRVSAHERARMHAAADAVGLSLSAWLRQVAIREARKVLKTQP